MILDADLRVRGRSRTVPSYPDVRGDPRPRDTGVLSLNSGTASGTSSVAIVLEEVLPRDSHFSDFEVDHEMSRRLGRRSMVLNARRILPAADRPGLILLAAEDATERRQAVETLAVSEARYRRLFETAQDGILLVDPETRHVFDANPFLTEHRGYLPRRTGGEGVVGDRPVPGHRSEQGGVPDTPRAGVHPLRARILPLRTHDDRGIEVRSSSATSDDVGAAP